MATKGNLFTQTEELKGQVKVDKATMVDLKDSFRAWLNMSDEAEVISEPKRIQEDEVRQCFERHMETWDPTERKVEAINEKVWTLSQSSDICTKMEHLLVWSRNTHGQRTSRTRGCPRNKVMKG